MNIHYILVPFDFTIEADNALKFAHNLATKTGAVIDLFNAVKEPCPAEKVGKTKDEIEALIADAKHRSWSRMEEIANHTKFNDVKIRLNQLLVAHDEGLDEAIARAAIEDKSDIIITGTKGAETQSGLLEESNSGLMIRKAGCPVLAIKHYDNEPKLDQILYASEFKERDERNFGMVAILASLYGSTVTLLHVSRTWRDQDEVFPAMRQLAERWKIVDYVLLTHHDNLIEKGIFNIATDIAADLIVLGYHKDRVEDHEFGSVAEDFVNHTGFPVLTLVM